MFPDSLNYCFLPAAFGRFTGLALALTLIVTLAACSSSESPVDPGTDGSDGTSGTDGTDGTDGDPTVESLTARLKVKSGQTLARDLAGALELPREAVCTELGRYDCADEVHRIALGGVEPYDMAIFNPLPTQPVTAPIAIDRLALAACTERARRDFEAPSEGLLAALAVAEPPVDRSVLDTVAKTLTQRLLLRDATTAELDELAGFYAELTSAHEEAGESTTDVPREWGTLVCFALSTHVEALFY